jgi:hypothetical protein
MGRKNKKKSLGLLYSVPEEQELLKLSLEDFHKLLLRICRKHPDRKPYLKILWTKELADFILNYRNHSNRRINQTKLGRMIQDIQADEFQLIHQGIAFKRNGTGQHRLKAVSETGKSVIILTMFNLDLKDLQAIDADSRSAEDIFNLMMKDAEDELVPGTQATMKHFFARMGLHHQRLSNGQKLPYLLHFRESLEWASKHIRAKYYGHAHIRAAFARAYYAGMDPEKLLAFWEPFSQMQTIEIGKVSLINTLRQSISAPKTNPEIQGFKDKKNSTQKYYISGEPLQQLQCKCVEVLLYHFCNDSLPTFRSLKVGVDRLDAGKLFTVKKPTNAQIKAMQDKILKTTLEQDNSFDWAGMEEWQDSVYD